MRVMRAALAASLMLMALAPTAVFGQITSMTTAFPAVVADPGATVEFTVRVVTDVPERVDLSVSSQPEGWSTVLRGGGSTISAVSTGPTAEAPTAISAEFTAEVTVPEDATAGSNRIEIQGTAASGTVTLPLDITIEAVEPGSVRMESDFPIQSGTADSTFNWDLELRNGSNQQITLSFGAEGLPAGWGVDVSPSGDENATTAVIDAGALSTVNVEVTPPDNAPAGQYPFVVQALGGPEPVEAQLGVEVTGNFDMSMTTEDDRLSARVTVGSSTQLNIVVTNEGSAPIENLALSDVAPRNWDVTFATDTIPVIAPQESETVAATIQSAPNAVAGDYVVTIRARNEEVNDEIEIRTTVESSPVGGLIGVGVLAIVAVGLFFVFQRYGRR